MLQILKMQQMLEQAEKKENEGEEDTKVIKIGSSVTKNNIYLLS
jgi:hypothetical protein